MWSDSFNYWDALYGAKRDVVSGQSYGGGNQSLNVSGYSSARLTLSSQSYDQWVEFAYKPNFSAGEAATAFMLTTNGGQDGSWNIKMGLSWSGSAGTIYLGGLGGGFSASAPGTAVGGFTNGEWQTISFQTNYTNNTYKAFLGGNSTPSFTSATDATFLQVKTLVFSTITDTWANTGNFYVDGINISSDSIYVVPEPSTALLGGLGLLALLRRRRSA